MKMIHYNPYSRDFQDDPWPIYRQLRDEAPVYRNDDLEFWALSRYDDVLAALLAPEVFSGSHGSTLEGFIKGNNLTYKDPPDHAWHRSPLVRWFTPREMAKLEPLIRSTVRSLLDGFDPHEPIEAVSGFASRLPVDVISELMGIPEDLRDTILELTSMSLQAPDERSTKTPLASGVDARNALYEILAGLLADRRAHPGDDLISRLLATEFRDDEGKVIEYDDYEFLSRMREFTVAGHETTSKLIANGLVALYRHPDQRRAVVDDPSLISNAVEEMLRFDGPTHYLGRWTLSEVEVRGVTIPAESRVLLLTSSANHDERQFVDAEKFDVRRKITRHVAFGFGPHLCLGAALARLEARVAFEELLARAPEYDVIEDGIERFYGHVIHGLRTLPMVLDRAPAVL